MSRVRLLFSRLRTILYRRLSDGFWSGLWFRWFQRAVKGLHSHTSLGYGFKTWIRGPYAHTLPGAPEAYQVAIFVGAGIWIAFIRTPAFDGLTTWVAHCFGYFAAGYLLYEMFLFLLDWLFVDKLPIENYRRALATLFVSSATTALLFSALLELQGCVYVPFDPIRAAYRNWIHLLKLEHIGEELTGWCGFFAHAQWWLGLLLVGVIIASLLGPIVRPERKKDRSGSSAGSR